MKRFSSSVSLAAVALGAAAASLIAGQPPGSGRNSMPGAGLGRPEHCLSTMDLSADQKTAVQGILSNNKAALRADVEAWKASQKKLQDDIAKGADKSVLGQDVLDQEASAAKVRGSSQSLRSQILAALTPAQQAQFSECSESRREKGRYPEPPRSNP